MCVGVGLYTHRHVCFIRIKYAHPFRILRQLVGVKKTHLNNKCASVFHAKHYVLKIKKNYDKNLNTLNIFKASIMKKIHVLMGKWAIKSLIFA